MAAPYKSFSRLQGTFRLLMPEKPALALLIIDLAEGQKEYCSLSCKISCP